MKFIEKYFVSAIRKTMWLSLCSMFLCGSIQKDDGSRKHLVIKTSCDYFQVDNLGNIYAVKEDELIKFLPSGKLFARYSNLTLGNISHMDVTNPLKILLYYRDYQQIIFLDDQLSVNSDKVALEQLGYEQTDLVCAGNNNSFWIYNKQNNELLRFNESSNKIAATGNLKQVLRTNIHPNFMLEHNGFLYLNCPDAGIYVFDIFGTFSKIISIPNLKQFQVNEQIIYYQKDSTLCSYDSKRFEETCKLVPNHRFKPLTKFYRGTVYSAFNDSITVLSGQ